MSIPTDDDITDPRISTIQMKQAFRDFLAVLRAHDTALTGAPFQPLDAGLTSLAALTTAADKIPYTTGQDVYAVTDLTAYARTILAGADAAAVRSTLDLVIGTNVQAYDVGLASIAGLTTAADKMIYTTASDTYAVTDLTAFARTLIANATDAGMRSTLGLGTMAVSTDGVSVGSVPLKTGATTYGDSPITVDGNGAGPVNIDADVDMPDNHLHAGTVCAGLDIHEINFNGTTYSSDLASAESGGTNAAQTLIQRWADGATSGPRRITGRSRGTNGTPVVVQDNDVLFEDWVLAYDGTNFRMGGRIRWLVDGTVSTGVIPTELLIQLCDSGGTLQTPVTVSPALVTVAGGITASGTVTCSLINTGLGPVECWAMNQNVRTTDSPTFAQVTATSGITVATSQDLLSAWKNRTSYTPTVSGSGGSAGSFAATRSGEYVRMGNVCITTIRLFNITNLGSWTGTVRFSLPFTAVSTISVGSCVPWVAHHTYDGQLHANVGNGQSYATIVVSKTGTSATNLQWSSLVTTANNIIDLTVIFYLA